MGRNPVNPGESYSFLVKPGFGTAYLYFASTAEAGAEIYIDNVSVRQLTTREITSGLMPYFCYPAADDSATRTNPYVGLILETSGDVVDVDHIALRTGGGAINGGTPIYTGASAVTRSADVVNGPASWSWGAQGTLLVETQALGVSANAGNDIAVVGFAAASSAMIYKAADQFIKSFNGSSNLSSAVSASTGVNRIAFAYNSGAPSRSISVDGAAVASDAAAPGPSGSKIVFGRSGADTYVAPVIQLRRIAFKAAAGSAADLQRASAGLQ